MTNDVGFLKKGDILFKKFTLGYTYTLCRFYRIFHGGGVNRTYANIMMYFGV